jgi:hypothetical protein
MTQELKLADNLLSQLKAGLGNSNTIREGRRDIKEGMLWFEGTESGERIPVFVSSVRHKTLAEITDSEAQANGESSREEAIKGMKALYANLGRPITDGSPITIIDYSPFKVIDPAVFMQEGTQERWRGGETQARWAKAGEAYTKADGTSNITSGGEVAILKAGSVRSENPLGDIAWALPKNIAESSYDISVLPRNPLDSAVATIQRKPTRVIVREVTEPVSYPSPFQEDNGAIRYSVPGDLLEKSARGPVVPVARDAIEARYISEELARTLSAKGVSGA